VRRFGVILAALALAAPATAHAKSNPQIAGLQVALRAHGLYLAPIDGIAGPRTAAAVHRFQRKHGLPVGVADLRTRLALGPLGRPLFGSRTLRRGDFGWDVSVLQFLLTRRGVYDGALDGYMGPETTAALRKYQLAMHLRADAVVGPRTLSTIVRRDGVPVRTQVASPKPATGTGIYIVRQGDSLTAIANAHGTTIRRLATLNKLDTAKPIIIGQKLRVPLGTARTLRAQSVNVRSILDTWSSRLGVDPHLVRALAWMESGYQTSIVSKAGAVGVLQTLPTTRQYVETVLAGRTIPQTVDGDVRVGVTYLKHLLDAFGGNASLALAGWYQGERAVREHGVYAETKPFVANVLALRTRM
jgi:peptidoglycan hydrolase-like protein with peptidoglycan-binding domain